MATQEVCSSSGYVHVRGPPRVHPTPTPLASKLYEEFDSSKVERKELKYLSLIVVCLVGILTYYLIFNFLLFLFKSYIACYYISNWQVEINNFGHGPTPSWLNTVLHSSRGSPQDSEEYVNYTFTLSITDNPSWLRVNVRHIRLHYGLGDIIRLKNPGIAFSGNINSTVHPRLYYDSIIEIGSHCLDYLVSNEGSIPIVVELEVEPSFFGHDVGLLVMNSLVYLSMSGENTIYSREMANACSEAYLRRPAWLSSLNWGIPTKATEERLCLK